jgi:hypothetical protein
MYKQNSNNTKGCPYNLEIREGSPKNQSFAGPVNEFDYGGGLQGSFPFSGPKYNISGDRGEPIKIIRNDGTLIGSYSHSIIRPFDDVHVSTTAYENGKEVECSWPGYSGTKHQVWCNKDNAVNYFAMRPLVTPDTYNGWLTNLFNYLSKPGNEVSKLLSAPLKPKIFCQPTTNNYGDEETVVMKWLMTKIAEAVNVIPQLQNNGPWRKEEFHKTDVQFYSFDAEGTGSSVYKIIFNLYNPLRSTATLIEAVIINPQNTGNFVIAKVNFVNSGEWKNTNENLVEGLQGFNLPRPGEDLQINLNSSRMPEETNVPWNYGNTLMKQQFNEFGYFEPQYNIKIEGGVPESLKPLLAKFSNDMLSKAEIPRYDGINPKNCQTVKNNGQPHMVMNNPYPVYNNYPPSQNLPDSSQTISNSRLGIWI